MNFSDSSEMQTIANLANEFFEHVLFDETPLFVSDEANIYDVSMAGTEELIKRCADYYGKEVFAQDLKQPLWKLTNTGNSEGCN